MQSCFTEVMVSAAAENFAMSTRLSAKYRKESETGGKWSMKRGRSKYMQCFYAYCKQSQCADCAISSSIYS